MIDRTYRCDGPDCTTHATTSGDQPVGFIVASERTPGPRYVRHFCSWDCVLRFAARIEPMEEISMQDGQP